MTRGRGSFQLALHLRKATVLQVGRWGTFLFPAGLFYTGSAHRPLEEGVYALDDAVLHLYRQLRIDG